MKRIKAPKPFARVARRVAAIPRRAPQGMPIEMLAASERAEAARCWQAVESRLPDVRLMCSWAWTQTWLEYYGDLVPHRFVVGTRDGEPCAIALLTSPQPRTRLGRALRPRTFYVGTAGEPTDETVLVERNGLVAIPSARREFAGRLVETLRRRGGWDRLELNGFLPEDVPLLERAGLWLTSSALACPVAALAPAADDVVQGLSGSVRSRARQTARAFGELTLDWASDVETAHAILAELIPLHRARWNAKGEPGWFSHRRSIELHQTLIERLGDQAVLARVRRDGETVGCVYGFVENRRLLFYASGLRDYDDNKLRAGLATHTMLMQACADRGLAEYDFLAPDYRYKRELSSASELLVWGRIERATPRILLERVRHMIAGTVPPSATFVPAPPELVRPWRSRGPAGIRVSASPLVEHVAVVACSVV